MKHSARRSTAALALLMGCLTFTGCAAFRSRAPDDRSIAIELPVSRAEAVRRTLSAFREQGYPVRNTLTSGTQPESEPFRQGDAEVVFRAAISGSERTSRVVLSGTYRRVRLGGTIRGGEEEVRRSDDPLLRTLWNRMDQLRLTIRGVAQ
ncbi:MAG: hypothetical protein ABIP93_00045 [Gemmatimonadaceae bacterium]